MVEYRNWIAAGRRVRVLLMYGVLVALALGGAAVWDASFEEVSIEGLVGFLALALGIALAFGLSFVFIEARPMLIAFRTPKEASSRSLVTALIYGLITPLVAGLWVSFNTDRSSRLRTELRAGP
jgi:hypothetical protein